MKVAFHTLGCKVNQYETEAMREQFKSRGAETVGEDEFADVYVINTCSVTNLADRKSRQYIRRMKKLNPASVVAVTGCYVQTAPEEVASIEGVDIVVGTNLKTKLCDMVFELAENRTAAVCRVLPYEELTDYEDAGSIVSMESRTRAYIKIQEGCNRFCSYCIIPYARGSVRSRRASEIVKEAETLVNKGFREIILTGINTALYGAEPGFRPDVGGKNAAGEDIAELSGIESIIAAVDAIPGDFRIRLSSLEPTVINAAFVKRLFRYGKLCHHLHLSAQSGSDSVLKAMNRRYDRAEYLEITRALKEFDPLYGITTDIIVGFPGETEEDFAASLALTEEVGFCRTHVFQYSRRRGTKAAEMADQVPAQVKKERSERLIAAGEAASRAFFGKNAGTRARVLFERTDEKTGMPTGYTDNYIKVYLDSADAVPDGFCEVTLTRPFEEGMMCVRNG